MCHQTIQHTALARIAKWLCGGAENDDSSALKTDSELSTDSRLKVDTVKLETG